MYHAQKVTKNDTLRNQSIQSNITAYVIGFNRLAVWVGEYNGDIDSFLCTMPYNTKEWIPADKLQRYYRSI